MNEHELPEDMSGWSEDPFALLGIARGVGSREVRSAYTRLIRKYKPEHYPLQFRRIRDAFEAAQFQARFFFIVDNSAIVSATEETNHSQSDENAAASRPSQDDGSDELMSVPQRLSVPPKEDVDVCWQLACDGEEKVAYEKLLRLDAQKPGQEEVCLRLYWLLKLAPELDANRTPCVWLAHGLQLNGLGGRLRELYRREIADDPSEGIGQRCRSLLETIAPAGLLVDLAAWRWQAVAYHELWQLIPEDVEKLRPQILYDDDQAWLRLLLCAVDHLLAAVAPFSQELIGYLKEIEKHPCQNQLSYQIDRLESLVEAARALGGMQNETRIPNDFLQLIPLSWVRPFPEIRPLVLRFLEQVARHPDRALVCFDRISEKSPAVLAEYGNILEMFRNSLVNDPADRQWDEDEVFMVSLAVRAFLNQGNWDNYEGRRPRFLAFYIKEAIGPESITLVLSEDESWAMAEKIEGDWPMRYVCQSLLLFHA